MRLYQALLFGVVFWLTCVPGMAQSVIPDENEILSDIATYQSYFKRRFPDVDIASYNQGVNALPQYDHRRKNWEMLSIVPTYEGEMELARKEWQTPFKNGSTFDHCFVTLPPANEFPYFQKGRAVTIEHAINQCLRSQREPELDYRSAAIARLVAAFREQHNGKPADVDFSDPKMREIYLQGRNYYWTKRGQNNFSCASCHVDNAGNRLRGDVLSAGLGQGTAFPAYRTRWALTGNNDAPVPWSTLHRRYATCNVQAGAAPLPPQSAQYIALEVYQAIMNRGIPIQSPSQRQ